jgi:hypothetical protein
MIAIVQAWITRMNRRAVGALDRITVIAVFGAVAIAKAQADAATSYWIFADAIGGHAYPFIAAVSI